MVEASNPALKEELMDKSPRNFLPFRRYSPHNKFESAGDKKNSAITRDSNPENKGASSSCSVQQVKSPIQRQIYVKPNIKTCYRCNIRCHISNVCLTRRVIVVVEE